jgi:hypothetical protein
MSLSPQQKAEIAQFAEQMAQQVHERTGWPPLAAFLVTAGLVAIGWYLDRRRLRAQSTPPQTTRFLAIVGLLNGVGFGSALAWGCYHVLDVGRIACLPGKRRRYCGDSFFDADGMHSHYDNLLSMYESPLRFFFWLLILAFFTVLAWQAFFWSIRALARWREL